MSLQSNKKILPIALDEDLYKMIEAQAIQAGESVNVFIAQRLADAVDTWNDYCTGLAVADEERIALFN
ncbi:MAG: hypothetical protein MJ247_01940 [Alphaproteobacteria bacterium]|nr:hypothetical protein [Alphaproteobacteria bacterium]